MFTYKAAHTPISGTRSVYHVSNSRSLYFGNGGLAISHLASEATGAVAAGHGAKPGAHQIHGAYAGSYQDQPRGAQGE